MGRRLYGAFVRVEVVRVPLEYRGRAMEMCGGQGGSGEKTGLEF